MNDPDLQRLDTALVARGLMGSRNRAAREISAGRVSVNGVPAAKPAQQVSAADDITVTGADPWVARSAHKLLGALDDLGLRELPAGALCLDAGASTGGFTQVLLDAGAAHVYAVDVGRDQLARQLRTDPRVTNLEGTNLRHLSPAQLTSPPGDPRVGDELRPAGTGVDLLVADVSFISLTLLADALLDLLRPGGTGLLMVKPQFECGRQALNRHGVVTDPADHAAAVERVAAAFSRAGALIHRTAASRLPGPSGNREFFIHITRADSQACTVD